MVGSCEHDRVPSGLQKAGNFFTRRETVKFKE
jgi:hypothetical protein